MAVCIGISAGICGNAPEVRVEHTKFGLGRKEDDLALPTPPANQSSWADGIRQSAVHSGLRGIRTVTPVVVDWAFYRGKSYKSIRDSGINEGPSGGISIQAAIRGCHLKGMMVWFTSACRTSYL